MEKSKKISSRSLMLLLIFSLFFSSTMANGNENIIDMRSDNNIEIKQVVEIENKEILLFNNYIERYNNDKFVKAISPYYSNILFEVDDYNMTVYLNETGIEKIVEGTPENIDLKVKVGREEIIYFLNNYHNMNTFEKIKYIINNLDMKTGDIIRLAGICMSVK